RRQEFVEWKVMRIDDAYTVQSPKPQSSVRGPADDRNNAASTGAIPYSVGVIEDRYANEVFRRIPLVHPRGPAAHLEPSHAHQAAGHLLPERVIAVLNYPMRRVARQAILAGQSCHAPVLYATQAALCGGPEPAVWIKSKACNLSLPQPVGSAIRCLDL